jgi:hypothetical protein
VLAVLVSVALVGGSRIAAADDPPRSPSIASVLQPAGLKVDVHTDSNTTSNADAVLEPGESVIVEPAWQNPGASAATAVTGSADFTGPAGASYAVDDSSADYGSIPAASTADCYSATSNCYRISLVPLVERPAAHWDATFTETLSTGDVKAWTVHVGDSFDDAAPGAGFYRFIETIYHNGITGGCGTRLFCPAASSTRAQMAVFLLVAEHGSGYVPPPATGTVFLDVPASYAFAPWIEQLAAESVTSGCGGGNYCPGTPVTRDQMAVFLLRTRYGSSYTPPDAVGIFSDVPVSSGFARWIEDLYNKGITGGCGVSPLRYCPTSNVTRGQMAVFLTTTFTLQLYGP